MASHFTGPLLNKAKKGYRAERSKKPIAEDPDYIVYWNDFLVETDYDASNWTITTTESGGSSASEALAADERGGALKITNDNADDDNDVLEHVHELYKLDSKRLWFKTRMKVSDATQSDVFMGLAINTGGSLLSATDRIGFQKDDGSTSILAKTEKDSTETSDDTGKTMSDDTYVELAIRWDGGSTVEYYVNGSLVAEHSTNVPDDEQLAVAFMIQNGESASKSMTIDYISAVQER